MPMHLQPAAPLGEAMAPQPVRGVLATACGRPDLEVQVLQSAAGFYIGTFSDEGPFTRESVEYFKTRDQAVAALRDGRWTQRDNV